MRNAQDLAHASLALTKAGDRDGWLALFAEDGVVEDPVGVSPLDPTGLGRRGKAAIAKFWDDVISHNTAFNAEITDGVLRGSVVERLYREVRSLRIYEGTSEIQHLVIARALTRG